MAHVFRQLARDEYGQWDLFCDKQRNATILHTTGWLDHRMEGELHIAGCFDGDVLSGGFPYLLNHRLGLKRVVKPRLTPYYGPVWADDLDNDTRDQVVRGLVGMLDNTDVFALSFHPGIMLPEGTLPPATSLKMIRTCLIFPGKPLRYSRNRRRQIRTGYESGVRIFPTDDLELIYRMTESSIERAGRPPLFEREEFLRLFSAMNSRNRMIAFRADHDKEGVLGTQLMIFDNHRAYNILSGIDWEKRSMHAGPMLMAHCIEWAWKKGLIFDFEGSSIETVFEFFQRFNPEVVHYPYHIYVKSRRIRWFNGLTRLLGKRMY
jgi:hypothetical protein